MSGMKAPPAAALLAGLGSGDAFDRPVAEALRGGRELSFERVAREGRDHRSAARQDAEEEAEHRAAHDRPRRTAPSRRARATARRSCAFITLRLQVLLEVRQDLGHAEEPHHDRHQTDAVEQLEAVEREPRPGP